MYDATALKKILTTAREECDRRVARCVCVCLVVVILTAAAASTAVATANREAAEARGRLSEFQRVLLEHGIEVSED